MSGCTWCLHPRFHAILSHRQAYRDSSGISPLQARHIMMPPTRASPPATQPTKRAEPKVYLQNRHGWLVLWWWSSLLLLKCTEYHHSPPGPTEVPVSTVPPANSSSMISLPCSWAVWRDYIPAILPGQIVSSADETQKIFKVLVRD